MRSLIILCIIALAAIEVVDSKCGCQIQFRAIGCRKDKISDRALPELLITERDHSSEKWNGIQINWKNWKEYLPEFACRCAELADRKGHNYFGLQFWGECWSGPSSGAEFEKHGNGDACYGSTFEKCSAEPAEDETCVGDNFHNFVYEIVRCPVKFEHIGCYKDINRPLPYYTLTDRDPTSKVSSGKKIDWGHFSGYVPDLACRCAMKALADGNTTFGLQFYGECWSGTDDDAYYINGPATNCIDQCYKDCANFNHFCIGKGGTNFVYRITNGTCEIQYSAVGCFTEREADRALGELIIDDVHPESPKFMGIYYSDHDDKKKHLDGLLCRCARKIKEKGYSTFAIHNGGECWSGARADETYHRHGQSHSCTENGIKKQKCTNNGNCGRDRNSVSVYKLDN